MTALVHERDSLIPLNRACTAVGLPRATLYRRTSPKTAQLRVRSERRRHPRRLSDDERQLVLDVLHEPRFVDQPPVQVFAELLGEGRYLCSTRTMHRVLAERKESAERRLQRPKTHYSVPRLVATAPNEVWTWDITKLATWTRGVFLSLYVVLDLFSRFVVAWMVAARENSALAKQLLAEAITRHGIEPGTLCVHQDRGAPMTATGFLDLLATLGAKHSHSRPRVSNDNAFSESQFKTLKYQPDFPGRFRDAASARVWCGEFFNWYNNHHHHSSLALFTPADVFHCRVDRLRRRHQDVLDRAYAAHPERFVHGPPVATRPPEVVAINPVPPEAHPATTTDTELVIPGAHEHVSIATMAT